MLSVFVIAFATLAWLVPSEGGKIKLQKGAARSRLCALSAVCAHRDRYISEAWNHVVIRHKRKIYTHAENNCL